VFSAMNWGAETLLLPGWARQRVLFWVTKWDKVTLEDGNYWTD